MLGLASPSGALAPIQQCQPEFRRPFPPVLQKFPSLLSTAPYPSSTHSRLLRSSLAPKASVRSAEFTVEPVTNVKFPAELKVPGCPELMDLLGTGYREKVFAIIGVKVYAAGFYAGPNIKECFYALNGKSASEIIVDSSVFSDILQAPVAKSLKILLVRDVDGKIFWNALDDVISPRIKEPTDSDKSALATFSNTFQGRDLKQGTSIFLTWEKPFKMLISVSSDGFPESVDAIIESASVASALFDAFFGNSPVSPTLKESIANGLAVILN